MEKKNEMIEEGKIDPSPIKEEFRDISMDYFVPIDDYIDPAFSGIYKLNKKGDILNTKTNELRKVEDIKITPSHRCPTISFRVGKIKKSYYLHKLKALVFLENSDSNKNTQVDHIDRNPNNHDLSNLRWVTPKENLANREDTISKTKYFDKYDENWNFIERIFYKDKVFSKQERDIILSSIKKGQKRKGFYYKRGDLAIDDYIQRFGNPRDEDWIPSPRFPGKVECNRNGMLRIDGEITIGSKDSVGHRHITINGERHWIHRLCQEAKTGKLLNKEVIIDHINTIPDDNRFENLREGTQKDNMNNPNTIEKFAKPVVRINPNDFSDRKEYVSVTEASKDCNIDTRTDITNVCNGRYSKRAGWIFAWKGEEENRLKLYNEKLEDKKCSGYWNDKEKCREEAKKYRTRTEFARSKGGRSAFQASKRNNWIDEFFPKGKTKN